MDDNSLYDFKELSQEEDALYFLYGFRNFFPPKKLMKKLIKLSKDSKKETKERYFSFLCSSSRIIKIK